LYENYQKSNDICGKTDSRTSRQILSRRGILPLQKSVSALKIVLLSMFFSSNVSYAVKETEERESLRKFLKISTVPSESEIYTTSSQYDPDNFSYFVIDILNELCPKRKSSSRGIIIEAS
jgi:ubiquitin C-terminal hydrolase